MKKAYRVSKIMEIILAGGISLKASDIHIEPEETNCACVTVWMAC
jgi:type II secretory ATPase GspE/PulE/Tfp pilus assembly ATPase PilB-like protein